jgi:F-type H+-transporting ATPase subunit epsilon
MLASLSVGELWYRKGEEKCFLSISYGFAEVLPDRVTILAKLAERAEDIDVGRAEEARKRAEERLSRPQSDIDYERARIALTKSLIRLQVSSRLPGGARIGELKRMRDAARG